MEQIYLDFLSRMQGLHGDIKQAIAGVSIEGLDWSPGADKNSINVLVVHTALVERYLISDLVGKTVIGRDPDAEFSASGFDEAELNRYLDESFDEMEAIIKPLTLADLAAERTGSRSDRVYTVGWALLHTLDHTAVHLGHIQMTRQLWDER